MVAPKFIDLFAGCGGLSLGLTYAGLHGQFVVERDEMAFETFADNFLTTTREVPVRGMFSWPEWLEMRAWAIDDFLAKHQSDLQQLREKIEVLAGGPPCQGFSFAGKRQETDPRNMLFEKYVGVVDTIRPLAIVLENVPGMKVAHSGKSSGKSSKVEESYYDKLKKRLEEIGYAVHGQIVDASRFGVPQKRSRLIVMGIRKDLAKVLEGGVHRLFVLLEQERKKQLAQLDLPEFISARDALSDLRTNMGATIKCDDPYSGKGFKEARYCGPKTQFQVIMHEGCQESMDSMRLARHTPEIRERFELILQECKRGVSINKETRERLGIKKHRTHPMAPLEPAPTITTLPDDVLHYAEPRILTVRESARLQTFPDWFRFRGKFTTGGLRRAKECPRYTQVGNAVPPFLGRAIGLAIKAGLAEAKRQQRKAGLGERELIAA